MVIIVVPVLITSCQVSEKPKKGPQITQITTHVFGRAITSKKIKSIDLLSYLLDLVAMYFF